VAYASHTKPALPAANIPRCPKMDQDEQSKVEVSSPSAAGACTHGGPDRGWWGSKARP
jgi:hypothetical protein